MGSLVTEVERQTRQPTHKVKQRESQECTKPEAAKLKPWTGGLKHIHMASTTFAIFKPHITAA